MLIIISFILRIAYFMFWKSLVGLLSIYGQLLQPGNLSSAHMTGTRSHDQYFQRKLGSIHHQDAAEILRFITVSTIFYYPSYIHNHYSTTTDT